MAGSRGRGGSMVTMTDVARVAGVSATTVSHVVNQSRRIDPETERVVRHAIETTGYVNDGVARSLRTGTTSTIGLAVSAISNPYFGDVVHAIEQEVTVHGHSLLLADTHDEPGRELRAVTDLLARRPDGILLAPSSDPRAALARIARRRIPTVLIDRIPPAGGDGAFDAIGVQNEAPMAALVRHLIDAGHRRIGLVAGRAGLQTTVERIAGFHAGHAAAGLPSGPELIAGGGGDAGAAVDELLGLADPPTALVMGNNQATIDAMRRLAERGVAVPRDLAVASFDDFPWADLFHPRLTAVRQPVVELGTRAVRLLFERLADPGLPPRVIRLEPELIVRDSSGAPSRKDPVP